MSDVLFWWDFQTGNRDINPLQLVDMSNECKLSTSQNWINYMLEYFLFQYSFSGSFSECKYYELLYRKVSKFQIQICYLSKLFFTLWKDIKEITISKWNLLDLFIVFQSFIGSKLVHSSISTPVFQSFSLLFISGVDSFIVLYWRGLTRELSREGLLVCASLLIFDITVLPSGANIDFNLSNVASEIIKCKT